MVVIDPPGAGSARSMPFSMGTGRGLSFGRGGSDDPFVVLPGEETPPAGVQATDGLWGLVTMNDAPVAFISPDIVTALDPDQQVAAALFESLTSAYVADFARQPRDFFRAQLHREVVGPVFILERRFADQAATHIAVTGFEEAPCDLGMILPIGEICDDSCRCARRTS